MGESKDDHLLLGGTAIKPKGYDRKGLEAFRYFLYNPETGEILSRTPLSWLLIFIFYVIYYGLLTAFWIASLYIFFLTLPENANGPRWMQDYSLIGKNPGVGIRPGPTDERIDSHLYLLKAQDINETFSENGEGDMNIDAAQRMEIFRNKNYAKLSEDYHKFDFSVLEECKDYPYGFIGTKEDPTVSPCLFLKLNKIWGWEPKPVDPSELDADKYAAMSSDLKKIIKEAEDKNQIWLDCQGYKPADKEKFDVTYYPSSRGLPVKYFPYLGGDYQPPLVAIKFNRDEPSLTGQLVHIDCRAWYDGVEHSTKDKQGLVRFEILFKETKELSQDQEEPSEPAESSPAETNEPEASPAETNEAEQNPAETNEGEEPPQE